MSFYICACCQEHVENFLNLNFSIVIVNKRKWSCNTFYDNSESINLKSKVGKVSHFN